eukprot:3201717-Alexandrium_andersonii.AAC.1
MQCANLALSPTMPCTGSPCNSAHGLRRSHVSRSFSDLTASLLHGDDGLGVQICSGRDCH